MTTLAANTQREYQLDDKEEYPVVADDIIYQNAAVGENAAGYARPLVAADPFLGFNVAKADNTGGSAGAIAAQVRTRGRVRLTVAGATVITANDRAPVYASDDDTFTLTATGNSLIGFVSRWIASTDCIVEFDAALAKAHTAALAAAAAP